MSKPVFHDPHPHEMHVADDPGPNLAQAAEPAEAPASAAAPAPNDKVVQIALNTPIARVGGPLTCFTLRKPLAGDLRGLSLQDLMTGDVSAIIKVLPRVSQPFITEPEAAALEADDIAEIGGAVMGFFMSPAQKAMIQKMMSGG